MVRSHKIICSCDTSQVGPEVANWYKNILMHVVSIVRQVGNDLHGLVKCSVQSEAEHDNVRVRQLQLQLMMWMVFLVRNAVAC